MRLERQRIGNSGEDGFMLLGLIVAIFIILLVLGVAAPRMAKSLQRDRELESMHRANQYVQAIRRYNMKNGGQFPGSIEQLEKTNNQRYLRRKYVDPLTGKADWRLIHVGEAKTTVKGFFGQPLAGVASAGLGSASGMNSGIGGAPATPGSSSPTSFGTSGSSSGAGFGSSMGSSGSSFGGASGSAGFSGSSGTSGPGGSGFTSTSSTAGTSPGTGTGGTTGSMGSTGSSGFGGQSGSSFGGGGAPFVGVGSAAGGPAIVVVNEQTTHPTWEFLYDPRVEAMRARTSIFGGGVASAAAGSLGSASGMNSGLGGGASGASTGTPGAAGSNGTSPSSTGTTGSFGSSTFGSPTPTSPTPTAPPTNSPQ